MHKNQILFLFCLPHSFLFPTIGPWCFYTHFGRFSICVDGALEVTTQSSLGKVKNRHKDQPCFHGFLEMAVVLGLGSQCWVAF